MHNSLLGALAAEYQWRLSLYALVGIVATTFVVRWLLLLAPTFKEAHRVNAGIFATKMQRPEYAANQKWNRMWSPVPFLIIFGLILPFCLTSKAQPVWRMFLDGVAILMLYDLFYYFVHRFLFHGPILVRVHAIHHRQHNPCRMDASYIHPLEVAIGLALYAGTVFLLSLFMGKFNVATIVATCVAFSEINMHNHELWTEARFPFKYLNYISRMHHNHHARFTGGNFATISLLFDWMFGTLDNGKEMQDDAKA